LLRVATTPRRRLLLLSDNPAQARQWLLEQLSDVSALDLLWIGENPPDGIASLSATKIGQHLGGECGLLVYDMHQGFHPDAFAAALGMLRGGGDCVLLCPPPHSWASFADPDQARFAAYPHSPGAMHGHFLARLARLWGQDSTVQHIDTGYADGLRVAAPAADALSLHPQQLEIIAAIERVAQGHARRPLVLTADRGRGKSTVLGVAARRLLHGAVSRITVVAPSRAAASTLLRHALDMDQARADAVQVAAQRDWALGRGQLRLRLPVECVEERDDAGLVLVDEAAAIPVGVLRGLLSRSRRLVFASTVHGYEGSGRGFELRFQRVLDREMPQWRAMRLDTPVRWAAGDRLEALLARSFVLDAEPGELERCDATRVEAVSATELAQDEALLRATFSLLVNAHYQTRPSDLRQLLDNPDLRLWLARSDGEPVGVLLALREGGFDQGMAAQVLDGRRRPRGHLLAQSLAVHAGLRTALQMRLLRIQRIAVHPACRRRGIGQALLGRLGDHARAGGYDALGTAFGIDEGLLAFWAAAGFEPARLGVRIDPASAAHSLFMLTGLSEAGDTLRTAARQRFQQDLPWSLAGSLRSLEPRLAARLLQGRDCSDLGLAAADREQLGRIATGIRRPATAESLVWKAVVRACGQALMAPDELAPLLAWRLQHRPMEQVCEVYAIEGRRALERRLGEMLGRLHGSSALGG